MKNHLSLDIYEKAQRFADLTKLNIAIGNIKRARFFLQKAEEIYINGSNEVKNIISNVYVFSVSNFMEIHHCNIKGLLPQNLQNEYIKQVNSSCI